MKLPDILTKGASFVAEKSPGFLTAFGITGFVTTVVIAVKATPKADACHRWHVSRRESIVNDPEFEDCRKEEMRKDVLDEMKELAPLYGPAVGMGVLSIACFVGASKVHADRQATLLAAYSLSEKTLATYQEKVRERLGEEVGSDIHNETMRELVRETEAPEGTLVVMDGKYRFYDTVLGRYFYSTREEIMAAESDINRRLVMEARVPLSEFYSSLGIEDFGCVTDCMGWDISSRYVQSMEIMFTPMFDDEKNPCTAMHYHVAIFDRSV